MPRIKDTEEKAGLFSQAAATGRATRLSAILQIQGFAQKRPGKIRRITWRVRRSKTNAINGTSKNSAGKSGERLWHARIHWDRINGISQD
jgi:hypothetical protein